MRLRSRSVHFLGTCVYKSVERWQNLIFSAGETHCFFGSRFYSAVLFSQVPKKCTDLDFSFLYNLIWGTYSKLAVKNNFLSLCARRSHRGAALLQTLQWLSKISKKIRRGCRKKQVGVLKRRVFRQCHFLIRHHELYLLHSCSDFHDVNRYDYVANVANFWERSQIRSSWFSLIYLHCSTIKQGEIYISFTNSQICNV